MYSLLLTLSIEGLQEAPMNEKRGSIYREDRQTGKTFPRWKVLFLCIDRQVAALAPLKSWSDNPCMSMEIGESKAKLLIRTEFDFFKLQSRIPSFVIIFLNTLFIRILIFFTIFFNSQFITHLSAPLTIYSTQPFFATKKE